MYRLHNITYFISNRCLFNKVSFTFNRGDRIGLIGANGAGKTTLLRILSGQLTPDEGHLEWASDTRIGYLQQESLEISHGLTVRQMVQLAFAEANKAEEQINAITGELSELDHNDADTYTRLVNRLETLQTRYGMLDGAKNEARAEDALKGLGFASDELDRPLSTFSGGWQMRALLARMLLEAPDILLLDEPTNHLDIDSIEWLERYLSTYPGAIIIVSHDQMFLNRMVTHIAALQHRKISMYPGNYDNYEKKYTLQKELQQQAWENQQREIEQAEQFINRFRAKATKARQVQSRIRQLEKLERIEEPEPDDASIEFRFPDPPRSGATVLELTGLNKTYSSDTDEPIHVFTHGQDVSIHRGDKIALIGANGAGKSTLARIVNGTEPFDGQRTLGHNVIMTFYAQHLADMLASERTVLEEMELSARSTEARSRIRGILGAFLFSGDDVFKRVDVLSGGERSRLALAKSLLEPANLLILDEPTNHLDLVSRKVLLRALSQYAGTVLAVSHDRFFLSGFAGKVWRVACGRVVEYPGDFTYYEWKVRQEQQGGAAGDPPAGNGGNRSALAQGGGPTSPGRSGEPPRGEAGAADRERRVGGPKSKEVKRAEASLRNRYSSEWRPIKKRMDTLEKEIAQLEERKEQIEMQLADPAFYESGDAAKVLKEHGDVQRRLDRAWINYEQVTVEYEASKQVFEQELQVLLSRNGV